jgi:uncharacterized membrane protein
LLVVVPIYLAILVLLKGMKSVAQLVQPFTMLVPEWLPAEQFLSLLLVLIICFLIGLAVRTRFGRRTREKLEVRFFEKIPGYALFRSLTQQVAGDNRQNVWKPALAEIEDGLVPAFIIEEFEDGRYTIFVPSVPTPFAGAVYVLERGRVHPLDVPFTEALQTISRWPWKSLQFFLMQGVDRKEPAWRRKYADLCGAMPRIAAIDEWTMA